MSARPELPPLRVLVVDDDEDNRRIVCRYLSGPPLQVETATDGHAAVEAVVAAPFDVILLDLEMPVMDGFEAAARVREIERATGRPRCLIVGFSGHQDDAVRQRSLAAGCDVYLTKPVSRAVLLQTVRDGAPRDVPPPPIADSRPDDPVVVDPDLANALPDFLRSRGTALDEADAVLVADDRGRLRRLAHRLAGSFGLYGFRWAATQCHRVEQDAEGAERAQLADMLAALRRHLETVDVQCGGRAVTTKGDPSDGGTRAPARRG